MLGTLIVGLGRSGKGLHLPVLRRARATESHGHLFSDQPVVLFDPRRAEEEVAGARLVRSLAEAADVADPAETVVHLCTPPDARVDCVDELAGLGFRRILVEKPLAVGEEDLRRIQELRQVWALDLAVVAPWLSSALTGRIAEIVRGGELGELRSISVLQRKPRFTRSLAGPGHPSAFDIEMPHALGVALGLAGPAEVADAAWSDMRFDDVFIPRMGRAWLSLDHVGGVRTEMLTDLTSPTRERRITLELAGGTLVGYYSSSEADHFSQLGVAVGGREDRAVFCDDALMAFMVGAYARFAKAGAGAGRDDLRLHADVVRLLARAKRVCERQGSSHILWVLCQLASGRGRAPIVPSVATRREMVGRAN